MLGFALFLVDVEAKTYLGAEVGTWACLRAGLGTQTYLGLVAQVASASFLRVPLRVGIGFR